MKITQWIIKKFHSQTGRVDHRPPCTAPKNFCLFFRTGQQVIIYLAPRRNKAVFIKCFLNTADKVIGNFKPVTITRTVQCSVEGTASQRGIPFSSVNIDCLVLRIGLNDFRIRKNIVPQIGYRVVYNFQNAVVECFGNCIGIRRIQVGLPISQVTKNIKMVVLPTRGGIDINNSSNSSLVSFCKASTTRLRTLRRGW